MNKAEFVEYLSAKMDHLSKSQVADIVDIFFQSIADALVAGERVELRGFGQFQVKRRPARMGRNPQTGKRIKVPAKRVPYFKPGKNLKDRIN